MHKPVIGISCNTSLAEGTVLPGMIRAFANTDYVDAVTNAGGIPILLPPVTDPAVIKEQVKAIAGIIISGGPDVNPQLYGEEPLEKLGCVNHARDEYELSLIKIAAELKKPILGICRGVQILNVAYGGTLYQDISLIEGANIKHFQSVTQRDTLWHTVTIKPASTLASILGEDTLLVNSFHHQALKTAAPGFTITAYSKDGVIEAVELPGDHFVLGVQWHPEMIAQKHPAMLELFKALVKQATL